GRLTPLDQPPHPRLAAVVLLGDLDRRAALVVRRRHQHAELHRIGHASTSLSEARSVTTFTESRYSQVKTALGLHGSNAIISSGITLTNLVGAFLTLSTSAVNDLEMQRIQFESNQKLLVLLSLAARPLYRCFFNVHMIGHTSQDRNVPTLRKAGCRLIAIETVSGDDSAGD